MTSREITESAFNLKKAERTPVTLIAGGEWYFHHAGAVFGQVKTDPQALAEVFVKAFRTIGHDMIWPGAGLLNYPAHCLGCGIKDDSTTSPALTSTAIKEAKEADRLDPEKALAHPIMEALVESHRILAERIGKETFILPTQWGPFTTAARLMGVEQMMMATITDPQGLARLLTISKEYVWSICERLIEPELIMGINFSEPVASGDLISKPLFEKFVQPLLSDLMARLKERGKYSMLHICGNCTPLLENVVQIAPHAFSLESKVDLKKAKEVLGGKVCVAGNVNPTGVFLSGAPAEVRAEARGCLEAWGGDPGYILTVGCDFPKSVPLQNIQALMSFKEAQGG